MTDDTEHRRDDRAPRWVRTLLAVPLTLVALGFLASALASWYGARDGYTLPSLHLMLTRDKADSLTVLAKLIFGASAGWASATLRR